MKIFENDLYSALIQKELLLFVMLMKKKPIVYFLPIALVLLFVAGSAVHHHLVLRQRQQSEINAIADAAAVRNGVDPVLVKAIIWKESRYRVNAVGKAGEIGLMQLYGTAVSEWSRRTGKAVPSRTELFRPETNIDIGVWYLSWTGKHWTGYKSALVLQISEYNAGYGNVSKYWKPKSPGDEVKLEQIGIKSTRIYVRDVMRRMEELKGK